MTTERKRRQFSEEFKSEAVRMSSERKLSEVARNLGIGMSTLARWRDQRKSKVTSVVAEYPEDLNQKCKRLEAENRKLRLEQEILKKATAYFAKDHI